MPASVWTMSVPRIADDRIRTYRGYCIVLYGTFPAKNTLIPGAKYIEYPTVAGHN